MEHSACHSQKRRRGSEKPIGSVFQIDEANALTVFCPWAVTGTSIIPDGLIVVHRRFCPWATNLGGTEHGSPTSTHPPMGRISTRLPTQRRKPLGHDSLARRLLMPQWRTLTGWFVSGLHIKALLDAIGEDKT